MITTEWTSTAQPAVPRISRYTVRALRRVTSSVLTLHAGKLLQAWSQTPTKWYPLPLAVGALLLVAIQYRHKFQRGQKEVHVNDEGAEIIKLKGPWQVRITYCPLKAAPAHHPYAGPRLRRSAIAQFVTPMGLYELARTAHLVPTLRFPLLLIGIWVQSGRN